MSDAAHLDYAAIGNGRLLALIGPDTSIDWLCLPRFDSPSLFGRLLDRARGGSFAIATDDGVATSQSYLVNTNVLRSEVETADGRFELIDFAPRVPLGLGVDAPLEVHRLLRPLAGSPRLRVHFDPQPDYARAQLVPLPGGIWTRAPSSRRRRSCPRCAPTNGSSPRTG